METIRERIVTRLTEMLYSMNEENGNSITLGIESVYRNFEIFNSDEVPCASVIDTTQETHEISVYGSIKRTMTVQIDLLVHVPDAGFCQQPQHFASRYANRLVGELEQVLMATDETLASLASEVRTTGLKTSISQDRLIIGVSLFLQVKYQTTTPYISYP